MSRRVLPKSKAGIIRIATLLNIQTIFSLPESGRILAKYLFLVQCRAQIYFSNRDLVLSNLQHFPALRQAQSLCILREQLWTQSTPSCEHAEMPSLTASHFGFWAMR